MSDLLSSSIVLLLGNLSIVCEAELFIRCSFPCSLSRGDLEKIDVAIDLSSAIKLSSEASTNRSSLPSLSSSNFNFCFLFFFFFDGSGTFLPSLASSSLEMVSLMAATISVVRIEDCGDSSGFFFSLFFISFLATSKSAISCSISDSVCSFTSYGPVSLIKKEFSF